MASLSALPEGWVVWSEEPGGRVVTAYRPDVFDTEAFPAACLPTVTVAPGSSPDRPLRRRTRSSSWYVALYLEPTVRVREVEATCDSREDAVESAVEAMAAFSEGEIDHRAAYQVPREAYLNELDDLLGGNA